MNRRALAPLAFVVLAALILVALTACGGSNQTASPAPSSPAATKASSSPSTSGAASPSTSAAASKPATAADQAYQKALADFKKVEEAARQEGEATIYSVIDATTLENLQKAFNKVDPKIQVKLLRVIGAQAIERIRGEQANKQYLASAYYGTTPQMAEEGLLQDIDLPVLHDQSIKWLVDPNVEKPLPLPLVNINKLLIMYNTQLVSDAEAPKTWRELADPKWKDKLMMWDPRISSYSMDLLGMLYLNPDFGPDYVKKVVLNTRVAADPNEAARSIARGESAMGFTSPGTFATLTDAPVKAIAPTDGIFATPTYYMLTKNAPQVNTARVFGNWLLSKEGQKVISEGYGTMRADVEGVQKLGQLLPGEKLLPGVPFTSEMQKKMRGEPVKALTQWMNEAGR